MQIEKYTIEKGLKSHGKVLINYNWILASLLVTPAGNLISYFTTKIKGYEYQFWI